MSDPRVEAIRSHPIVGRNSCSHINECWDDNDIIESLNMYKYYTPELAVKWALDRHESWLEQALNSRWGSDDDPELKQYNDYQEWKKNNAN